MEGNELLDFLIKKVEKYQSKQNPNSVITLPFRAEIDLGVLPIY